jgi:hypothetical protein
MLMKKKRSNRKSMVSRIMGTLAVFFAARWVKTMLRG